MSPDQYEQITSEIVAGICAQASALVAYTPKFGRTCKVLGKSGYRHQIDVCLTTQTHLYLIECKRWEDRIGVAEVMTLAARGNDVAAEHTDKIVHVILASTKGASRNSLKLASFFRVQIEIVKSASEFGMQIGNYIHLGIADTAVASDSCDMEVINRSRAG